MINAFCSLLLLYKAFLVTELIGTEIGPAGKIATQLICIVNKQDGAFIGGKGCVAINATLAW